MKQIRKDKENVEAGKTRKKRKEKKKLLVFLPSLRAMVMKVLKKPACFPVIDMTWILDLTQSMG